MCEGCIASSFIFVLFQSHSVVTIEDTGRAVLACGECLRARYCKERLRLAEVLTGSGKSTVKIILSFCFSILCRRCLSAGRNDLANLRLTRLRPIATCLCSIRQQQRRSYHYAHILKFTEYTICVGNAKSH